MSSNSFIDRKPTHLLIPCLGGTGYEKVLPFDALIKLPGMFTATCYALGSLQNQSGLSSSL